jgi:hypothetical protein
MARRSRIAAALALVPLAHVLWMVVARSTALRLHEWVPMPLIAFSYLWNVIVAPATALSIGVSAVARRLLRPLRPPVPPDLSRRTLLRAPLAFVPSLAAGGTLAFALPALHDFRVRRLRVPLPRLPERLDGATLVHLSDMHYGKFTKGEMVDRVVDTVNGLDADLVFFTGDLIDLSLGDLPAALDALARIHAKQGLFACEGNHDLIEDGAAFRRRAREARVNLLLDESRTIEVRGEPVRIHGTTWRRDAAARREAVRNASDGEGFPILLAHHPHTFDDALAFPLTFSGHTHGGMLMWNERLGAGPVLFRYWSGLYERDGRALVVSNGIGNWFPLRTRAPAEILHVTLERVG